MAQTIKLKRSATQGAVPSTSDLALGELAVNTYDGKIYIKKDSGSESIVEVGASGSNADTVDNLHASSFLRSDTSDTAFGSITFTAEQKFGASYSDPDSGVQRDAKFGTNGIAVSGGIKTDSLTTSGNISFGDNDKAVFGASSDLQIYHDGGNSYVSDQGQGELRLRGSSYVKITDTNDEVGLQFRSNGAVSLYHNNVAKFETTSTGIDVTGVITTDGMTTSADINFGDNDKAVFGAGNDLQIYHDGSNSYVYDTGTGGLYLRGSNEIALRSASNENIFLGLTDGSAYVYHNGSVKLYTTSSGIDVTGTVTATGGNSTNWNTAYGWGNHASAGYLTGNQTITLSGDVSGSGTTSINVTVADDSHNHIISNVDGLQSALDAKLASSSYTASDVLTKIKTVDGSGSGLDADTLDGQHGSYYFSDSNKPAVADITGLIEGTSFSGTYPIVFNIGGANRLFSENNITYTGATNTLNIDGNTAWHAGNDGSGSGLDADTVDGIQASRIVYGDGTYKSSSTSTFHNNVSGFHFYDAATNAPTAEWYHWITCRGNSWSDSDEYSFQIANSFWSDSDFYVRRTQGGTEKSWNKIWTAASDGSGSGLDADTVDGQHESTFMRRSANSQLDMNNNDIVGVDQIVHEGDTDTYMQFHADNQWRVVAGGTERLEVNGGNVTVNANLYVSDQIRIGDDAWIEDFNNANAIRIKGNQSSSQGYIAFGNRSELLGQNNSGTLTFNGNTVWHQGNDGSGSGLDADTLDGSHSTAFVTTSTGLSSNLDTEYRAGMKGWHASTTGKPADNYGQMLSIVSSGSSHNNSNNWITQLGFGTNQNTAYFRSKTNGGSWGGWKTFWHTGNDGSGSGLDADTVDGVHESTFMRRSANSQLDMNNNDIIGVDQIIHEGDSDTYMQFHAADQWRVVTGGTERFEVNNSNVTVNKQLLLTAGTDAKLLASGQYGHTFMYFRNSTDTSNYGLIYHSGNSMVYGTSSDYRLKENVVPLEGASEKLKLIPVKSFNFIEDPSRTVDGFLAHELQEHIPEAVVGEKDGIDEDGNPEYQAVDQSKLTPLLTAALQEALAKIEELEQRIENLENN